MQNPDQINHIVRNGLVDIKYHTRRIGRSIDDILKRCKEMEKALDKVEVEDKEEQRKAFRAEL